MGAAESAFAAVKSRLPFERAELLRRAADGIRGRREEFIELLIAEAGKPVSLAEAEIARAEQTFLFAAREALEPAGSMILELGASAAGKGHTGSARRFPLGVILAITPFNFPLNLVAHKVAPALAAGNTVLLKPSPRTPLCSLLLGEIVTEAGFAPGELNVVPFDPSLVGALLDDRRVKMISFTGSAAIGWGLKTRATKQKVTLELGGNAAAIIHSDADWQSALGMLAASAFGYAGQSCISLQRLYVQRAIYDDFKSALVTHVRNNVIHGDPRRRDVIVGPLIDLAARDRVLLAWVDEAMKMGAKLLTDLHPGAADRCLPPIILEGMPAGAHVTDEEVFGPVVLLEPYDAFEEALEKVNASRYGLQATVFTRDLDLVQQAFETLEVGGVLINEAPSFRVENMPYGGVKDSGFGREGVAWAMEEMSELRALIVRNAAF